jgi:PLP dependent protein
MGIIQANLQAARTRVAQAAHSAGREASNVQLLAVSKTMPAEALQEAYEAGQRAFGENYVQELVEKVALLKTSMPQAEWHFIGPLQSNKTRLVAQSADWVHSIERLKIAERLSEQRSAELAPLQVCLQVNISGELSKSGVNPAELAELAHAVAALPRLKLRGLMCIPEAAADEAAQRAPFAALRDLFTQLKSEGLVLDTLSMGMSADLEAAIAEGATCVRIGTAIFGARQ